MSIAANRFDTAARIARGTVPSVDLRLAGAVTAILLASIAFTSLFHTNPDVSWLLTLCERWLDGERPYVDFIEVNPPGSILLYMPAVLLARICGLSPERWTILLTALSCLASVTLSAGALDRAGLVSDRDGKWLFCGALALLLFAPYDNFAEREHLAVLAALPWLAVLAARARGTRPTVGMALLGGAIAGIAMAIKPMFALGFAGPLLFVLRRQGLRPLLAAWDLHAAWLVTGIYGLVVLTCFPAFTAETLRWVMLAYVPSRPSLMAFLAQPATLLWLALLLSCRVLRPQNSSGSLVIILLAASAGFGLVYLLQGKGWNYQALPALLLAGLAVLLSLPSFMRDAASSRASRIAIGLTALGAALAITIINRNPPANPQMPALRETIARVAPHPRMMAITFDLAVGHPLVRELGGRWVGTFCSNWITNHFDRQAATGLSPEKRTALQALSDRERTIVTADIVSRKPDVVLLENGRWIDYVNQFPPLKTALSIYRPQGHFGEITLLVRQQPVAPTPESGQR